MNEKQMNDCRYLKRMARDWHSGNAYGIMAACTASAVCIEAAMLASKKRGAPVLIEATANQVNQLGGYTGMRPRDYYAFVMEIAKKTGISLDTVILGGDHLGPLPFKAENETSAMQKAEELVAEYTAAGFSKIHLDASMALADDDIRERLPDKKIAERSARLAVAALSGFRQYKSGHPDASLPVFIIGSEVPIPGGVYGDDEGLVITKSEDLDATLATFKTAFLAKGLAEVWENVIGVVVQPGVEFGDDSISLYDSEKTRQLTACLRKHDGIIFEGHSTDHQTPSCLKNMVHDGICILKVGPALTFYQREALFALSSIEKELLGGTGKALSCFPEVLEDVMLKNPSDWQKYYHGTVEEQKLKRKYSYSDRSRYYFHPPGITASVELLMANLSLVDIPIPLLSQYMPVQAKKIRLGQISKTPHSLIISRITDLIDEYTQALG
jgi:D-tagatose-1,6-bisphosphate aldolase subunit GatZ/KbaZ